MLPLENRKITRFQSLIPNSQSPVADPQSLLPPAAMYDAIIIGAGMSGLAAGIRLAHFGKRVCILERHSAIGGLNSFYRQRGRTYDVGLHALTNYAPKGTRSGPLARLLRQLRIAWEEWALAPQLGSAIVFPAQRCGSPTISSCSKPRCGGCSPGRSTTSAAC